MVITREGNDTTVESFLSASGTKIKASFSKSGGDNADAYFHIFNTNAYTNNPTLYMNSNPVGDLPQSSFVMAWEFTAAVSPGN